MTNGSVFIIGDLSEKCYTEIHKKFLFTVIIPSLITLVIVVPSFLFLWMWRKMKNDDLYKIQNMQLLGFIYTEY